MLAAWEDALADPCLEGRYCPSSTLPQSRPSPRAAFLFPRASERRVLPIAGVCKTSSHLHIFSSSHLLILTSSHLHILTSSHLLIFTSSHLHAFSFSHLLIFDIFSSSHLHIFSSSHLLILTFSHLHICSSSHLLIFTSSYLLILTSSHLDIFSSSHLLIFTSSHPQSSHLHICSSSHRLILNLHILTSSHLLIFTSSHSLFPSCSLALLLSPSFSISLLKARGSANETAGNATLSHEMTFDSPKTEVKLRFLLSNRNPFARK